MARLTTGLLVAAALLALVLRLLPVAGVRAAWSARVFYDTGVYFTASALLLRGHVPYRDFVLCHPPGGLYLLAPAAALPDPATGFAAARALAALVGSANALLAGLVAARSFGPVAGVSAALLYATYGEAVAAEQGPFLEPFLNLACLAAALVWLREPGRRPEHGPGRLTRALAAPGVRDWLAGALLGLAVAVKLQGVLWILASIAACAHPGAVRPKRLLRLLTGLAVSTAILVLPLAIHSPGDFLEQVVRLPLRAPAVTPFDADQRLGQIFTAGHLLPAVLGALGAVVACSRLHVAGARAERLFAAAYLLTLAAFLSARSFLATHYTDHLAASECVLAGLAVREIASWCRERPARWAAALLLAIAGGALQVPALRAASSPERLPGMLATARAVAALPAAASVFALEPAWTLAGGRLPGPGGRSSPGPAADPHGWALLQAMRREERHRTQTEALLSPDVQHALRAELVRHDFVLTGPRGALVLDRATREWFVARFTPRTHDITGGAVPIWERKRE